MATVSIDCPLMAPGEYDDETELRRDEPGRIVAQLAGAGLDRRGGAAQCVVTGRTTLGSAPGAQVRIADREVSRLHAELEPTERGTWVRDLGSRNGTFVENLQVAAAMLPDGARIRVGGTDVVLHYPREASPVELWPETRFGGLLGASTPMRELFAQLSRVAQSDAPVLIQGETGTGKELVARAIHDASARAGRPVRDRRLRGAGQLADRGRAVRPRARRVHRRGRGARRLVRGGGRRHDLPRRDRRAAARRCSRSCCACWSRAPSSAWARASTGRSTCASSRPPTATCAGWSTRAPSARISTSASRCCRWCCRRCARARATSRCCSSTSWRGGGRSSRCPSTSSPRCPGWATCASCATSSSARARSARKDALQSSHSTGELPAVHRPARSICRVAFDQPFKEFRERWIDHGEREYLQRLLERHGRNVPAAAEEAGLDRTYVYRLIRKHGL